LAWLLQFFPYDSAFFPTYGYSVYEDRSKMNAKKFSVSQDQQGTYELRGEITIHELDAFKDFLERCLKGGEVPEIAISLADVGFIDTAAIQLLIAFKMWLGPGVKLRIAALSAEVEDILSLCGLKGALV
jgi:anti-anti-sigma factor